MIAEIGKETCGMCTSAVVASGANVDDAEESLRLRAAWHAANELRPAMKAWETFGEKKRRALYECYQGGWYTANTPLGVPVYVERLGTVNMDKLLESITLEDLLQHRLRMQGYMVKTLLPEMAKRDGVIARDKIIHVIDMKGAGLSLVGSKNINIFKELQQIDKNFPEFLYRTYIVNVPLGARIVWTTFSALLPARVRAKVRILGAMKGGNLAKLSQIMGGDDHVPDFLGGKCARRLDQCPPWSLEHMNDTEFVPWEKGVLLTRLAAAAPLSPDSFARVHSRVRKKAVKKISTTTWTTTVIVSLFARARSTALDIAQVQRFRDFFHSRRRKRRFRDEPRTRVETL